MDAQRARPRATARFIDCQTLRIRSRLSARSPLRFPRISARHRDSASRRPSSGIAIPSRPRRQQSRDRSIAYGRGCTRLFIHSGIYPPRPRGQLIIPNQARLQAPSRFNNVAISHFNAGISSARRESALLRVNDLRSLMSAHRERERERERERKRASGASDAPNELIITSTSADYREGAPQTAFFCPERRRRPPEGREGRSSAAIDSTDPTGPSRRGRFC
jgi:hypothetical protein